MMSQFRKDLSVVIGAAKGGDKNLKLPFYLNSETGKQDTEALGLTPRSFNSLYRNGLKTVEAVVDKFSDLSSLRNVGEVSRKEIRQKVADYLYDEMTPTEKKLFWKEFIRLNNIKGIS